MTDARTAFPDCLHWLAAAMHSNRIDPQGVEIHLPHDQWFALYQLIERKLPAIIQPAMDGRLDASAFRYMGFQFMAKR